MGARAACWADGAEVRYEGCQANTVCKYSSIRIAVRVVVCSATEREPKVHMLAFQIESCRGGTYTESDKFVASQGPNYEPEI